MELNRRNFIKLLVGGAVGMQVTPLPWKLTDDIAIWTQNWPWVPVPPVGAFESVKSVCTLCPGGCGIEVRKVDDRAVKIEGRTDYPVNPGGLCPVGMGGLQLLYDEDIRFTRPMKRVGPRGAGQFKDISWEEALEMLSSRISNLRSQGKPEALAAVDGSMRGSTMSLLIERFLKAVGSPNYLRIPDVEDTYWMTNVLMTGHEGPLACDIENADFVLSFGCGFLEGWQGAGRIINAWSILREKALKKKAKVVQVASRASNTASKADRWMAVRPGTEGALALGISHVLINEGLYDKNFVNKHSFGFENWTSSDGKEHIGFKALVLKKYSPRQVAQITGLKPSQIISLAIDFAKAKAPVALLGKGKGALNGSLYEFMSVMALNALAGNLNQTGGLLISDPLPLNGLPDFEQDALASKGTKKPRLDGAGGPDFPLSKSLLNKFAETVAASPASPVDTLLVFSSNPAFTLPDGGKFRKALKKIPFIVSFSPFRDETALMADLILPDHTYLEKMDDVPWPAALQFPLYGLSRPVVEPLYDTRHSGEVILQTAKKLGNTIGDAFPWEGYEDILKIRVKGLFNSGSGLVHYDGSAPVWQRLTAKAAIKPDYKDLDELWEFLKTDGLWYRPQYPTGAGEYHFKTPTGKFEFYSTQIELAVSQNAKGGSRKKILNAMGVHARGDEVFMPHFEKTLAQAGTSDYPLQLVPYEMVNLASSWVPNPPFLKKTLFDNELLKDESFAEINPRTADKYHLKEGQRVWVESPSGKVKVRVTLFEGAMPGVVYLPLGLGHSAYDEFLKGKGSNPNDIIYPSKDPVSGLPVWWNTPVRITKA
ncbi:MAG: molybdopterin-dependent oxidoreductase [Deltaproteobacteria bacterium]|nr:molybdopterin-dependent oxidoreductase [Deltaproteobacteria bacterium]